MPLRLNCKETTRLVLEGEDRPLTLAERTLVRLHQMMCGGCTRFAQQVGLMRGAMNQWRRYADEGGSAADAPAPPRPD
jgi:hypothetical protein